MNSKKHGEQTMYGRPLMYLALVVLLLNGCDLPREPTERTLAARTPVVGGSLDEDTTSVVAIVADLPDGYHVCSGTLILPNLVLTARHCVAFMPADTNCADAASFGPDYAITQISITTDSHWDGKPDLEPAEIWENVDSTFCGADQALILLANDVDPALATPVVPRVDEPPVAGETFVAVGFGATDPSGAGVGIRHKAAGFTIDCVGADCNSSDVTANEWSAGAGFCKGDSGASALDSAGRIVGTVSRGFGICGQQILGQTSAYGDWLRASAVEAAKRGGFDAPPWAMGWPTDPAFSAPIGAACQADSDCAPGLCDQTVCTRQCNDSAPCPDGSTCEPLTDGTPVCRAQKMKSVKGGSTKAPASGCSVDAGAARAASSAQGLCIALMALVAAARLRRTQKCHAPRRGRPGQL